MACPFFLPTERCDAELWPHSARLPLGGSWRGRCTAPGHEGEPSEQELRDGCNLGYARCGRLPQERPADALRFCLAGEQEGRLRVRYVFEIAHRPGEHGVLEFDRASRRWISRCDNACLQRMAECFVQAKSRETLAAPASTARTAGAAVPHGAGR